MSIAIFMILTKTKSCEMRYFTTHWLGQNQLCFRIKGLLF